MARTVRAVSAERCVCRLILYAGVCFGAVVLSVAMEVGGNADDGSRGGCSGPYRDNHGSSRGDDVRVTTIPKFACKKSAEFGISESSRPEGLAEGDRYDTRVAAENITAKVSFHQPILSSARCLRRQRLEAESQHAAEHRRGGGRSRRLTPSNRSTA